MDRAADAPKASEPEPAVKSRAQSKKSGASVTKKAAGETAPKKSPARKAPGEAPAASKSKTRAASRKKGDA
jgi:sec-independent protein translocase protein TatB